MAMKVTLILVLLNSLFTIQACIRQETKERKNIYVAEHIKKEVPIPLDTSVNGIILDDTVSLNNILGKRLPVIDVSDYGECTVCSNIDGSEYLILCINYGGYINQYDRFVVVPSHSITQSRRIQRKHPIFAVFFRYVLFPTFVQKICLHSTKQMFTVFAVLLLICARESSAYVNSYVVMTSTLLTVVSMCFIIALATASNCSIGNVVALLCITSRWRRAV